MCNFTISHLKYDGSEMEGSLEKYNLQNGSRIDYYPLWQAEKFTENDPWRSSEKETGRKRKNGPWHPREIAKSYL